MTLQNRLRKTRPGHRDGFTLLEVLLATSLMTVGAVSVLVVLASAAGYAATRQSQQRLTQVLEEARNEARTLANGYRPARGAKAKLPGGEDATTDETQSNLYAGYRYTLSFGHVDSEVPEAGYRVTVNVGFGDEQNYQETLIVAPDTVADEEFTTSESYDLERQGKDASRGGNESD